MIGAPATANRTKGIRGSLPGYSRASPPRSLAGPNSEETGQGQHSSRKPLSTFLRGILTERKKKYPVLSLVFWVRPLSGRRLGSGAGSGIVGAENAMMRKVTPYAVHSKTAPFPRDYKGPFYPPTTRPLPGTRFFNL